MMHAGGTPSQIDPCPNCGAPRPAPTRVCPNCGAGLGRDPRTDFVRIFCAILVGMLVLALGGFGACVVLIGVFGVGGAVSQAQFIVAGIALLALAGSCGWLVKWLLGGRHKGANRP